MLTSLFSLFYVTCEFHRVLHRGRAGNHVEKKLPWHGLNAQLFLKLLLITQHEVPFINTSEATKSDKKV